MRRLSLPDLIAFSVSSFSLRRSAQRVFNLHRPSSKRFQLSQHSASEIQFFSCKKQSQSKSVLGDSSQSDNAIRLQICNRAFPLLDTAAKTIARSSFRS